MLRHLVLLAIASALVCGCGGRQSDDSSDTMGGGDDTMGGEEGGGGGGGEGGGGGGGGPAATGPGRLRVINKVGSEEAHGNVRVLNESGEVVAQGRSGETFTLPAGTYRLVGQITDRSELIDTPTRESDQPVTLSAGGEVQTASIDHPLSRVRIRVTRRGRPVGRWSMEVRRQGAESGPALQLRSGGQHVPVTPGRYSGTLHIGSTRIEVNGIIFQGGATMDVPVNVN